MNIATAKARKTKAPEQVPHFVETDTAIDIHDALGMAHEGFGIALIYGASGVGKSHAVASYRDQVPNVLVVQISPVGTSCAQLLGPIAVAINETFAESDYRCRVATYGPHAGGALLRDIVRVLKGLPALLVIDDAHRLNVDSLSCVASLYDAAGIGIALVGDLSLGSELLGAKRRVALEGLTGRVGPKRRVRVTSGDIAQLASAYGAESSIDFLAEIAVHPGGLRGVSAVLQMAWKKAQAGGRAISLQDMRTTWARLGGQGS
jgi:hypothetical protein